MSTNQQPFPQLGDKVRIKKGCVGEGYTFYITATGKGGMGERVYYGGTYGPARASDCELVSPMKCDR
jgi:hypothetical protein